MFVIAGVTGNTGSVVASMLLAGGHPVRVVVRRPEAGALWRQRGAEVATADLGDRVALSRALDGAAGAYLLTPPNLGAPDVLADRRALASSLRDAVQQAGVPRVVYLSSLGAHRAEGTGIVQTVHSGEALIGPAAPQFTALRADYFLDNWAQVFAAAKQDGVLPSFLAPETALPMVSTRDIGRVASELLTAAEDPPPVVELSGPQAVTTADVAATLSELLERPVTPHYAPLEAVVPTFTAMGAGEDGARLYRDFYAALLAGRIDAEHPDARVRGRVGLRDGLASLL